MSGPALTRALAALAVAAASIAGPALADERADERAVMLDHIAWIVAHSDFEYHGEKLPGVLRYRQAVLQEMMGRAHDGVGVYAIYDHTSDDILVPEGFDFLAPENQPTIVHELVHYLQDLRGEHATTDCVAALEPPAYRLHARWAEQHGIAHDDSGLFDAVVGIMAREQRVTLRGAG